MSKKLVKSNSQSKVSKSEARAKKIEKSNSHSKSEAASSTPVDITTPKESLNEVSCEMRNTFKRGLLEKLKLRIDKSPTCTELNLVELEELVNKIELEFFSCFSSNIKGYKSQYHQIAMNVTDLKNKNFFLKILSSQVKPEDLPKMKTEDMASEERTAERQKLLETQLEQCVSYSNEIAKNCVSLVLGQHVEKGLPKICEEDYREILHSLVENKNENSLKKNSLSETYNNLELGLHKTLNSPLALTEDENSAEFRASDLEAIQRHDLVISDDATVEVENSVEVDTLEAIQYHDLTIATDTTENHENHVFCIDCRICTNKQKLYTPSILARYLNLFYSQGC